MLGRSAARSSMIFEARNSSRRLTIVSSLANLEMKIESSIAESPPPITITSLALEEGAVADPAGGDAAAAQLHLAGDAEPARLGPHRQDHGLCEVLLVAEEDLLDAAVGELDPVDVVGHEAGPEALGLGAKLAHHLRPHDPLGIAGVVLDVGRVLQLAAPLEALEDERLEIGARGVERRGVAGRPTADDDHVLDLLYQPFLAAWKSNTLLFIVPP